MSDDTLGREVCGEFVFIGAAITSRLANKELFVDQHLEYRVEVVADGAGASDPKFASGGAAGAL